jgi:hypothetical protein
MVGASIERAYEASADYLGAMKQAEETHNG